MLQQSGHILVVDDNVVNRMVLARALAAQGHTTDTAQDGQQALRMLHEQSFDVVLLDIVMPEMDGYQTLAQIKQDSALRHLPVIMISAVDEMDSVIRCIEMGATDYLLKPFNAALLQARLNASLAGKRLRDLEIEYLEQVSRVADAAAAVEANAFSDESLDGVAARADALGRLARVFQRMAREVHAREQRLKLQLQQLQLDIEERQKANADTIVAYIPMDRRHALARGRVLPDRARGAALFADISGFTPLTEALARELGFQRGAEELTRQLNRVYTVLIDEVHRYGGSVLNFSGDAVTGWFDSDDGLRAIACGLGMQTAMRQFAVVTTAGGAIISIGIKVAVAVGAARRFLVGDPGIQNIEVLAGRTLDDLARIEHQAQRGELLIDEMLAVELGGSLVIDTWRMDDSAGRRLAIVGGLTHPPPTAPWPDLPPNSLTESQALRWLLRSTHEKVQAGHSDLLSELRPAAALFLKFSGIDYDADDAEGKLNAFVTWAQAVVDRYDGSLLQLTIGDKGSYLYAAFGAPIAHYDDATRAVSAAFDLQTSPPELHFITAIQIGLAYGQMRAGANGGAGQRTYAVLGDKTNIAARLMQAAADGILCDGSIYEAAREQFAFAELGPLTAKGKSQPIRVYRAEGKREGIGSARSADDDAHRRMLLIDHLSPDDQLALKVASVIGPIFSIELLNDVFPDEDGPPLRETSGEISIKLKSALETLETLGLICRDADAPGGQYRFSDAATHTAAYNHMLFAQRRQMHRAIAEWHERVHAADTSPYFPLLAHHWREAEDAAKAIDYLEKAGEQARQRGAFEEAQRFFNESLTLDAQNSVLRKGFDSS